MILLGQFSTNGYLSKSYYLHLCCWNKQFICKTTAMINERVLNVSKYILIEQVMS